MRKKQLLKMKKNYCVAWSFHVNTAYPEREEVRIDNIDVTANESEDADIIWTQMTANNVNLSICKAQYIRVGPVPITSEVKL